MGTWIKTDGFVERRLITSLSKDVYVLIFLHCVLFMIFFANESTVLLRSLLAVPNTFLSFFSLSCRKKALKFRAHRRPLSPNYYQLQQDVSE